MLIISIIDANYDTDTIDVAWTGTLAELVADNEGDSGVLLAALQSLDSGEDVNVGMGRWIRAEVKS